MYIRLLWIFCGCWKLTIPFVVAAANISKLLQAPGGRSNLDSSSQPKFVFSGLLLWGVSNMDPSSCFCTIYWKYHDKAVYKYNPFKVCLFPDHETSDTIWLLCTTIDTRNTLTQASKNGRKPHLFPQKKLVSLFYAINIFNTIYYFKPTNFLFTMIWNKK